MKSWIYLWVYESASVKTKTWSDWWTYSLVISQHQCRWKTISVSSTITERSLWRGGSDGLDCGWKRSEPWQALSCMLKSRWKSRGRPARRRLDDVKELTDWRCVIYGKRQRIVCYAESVSVVKPQRIDYCLHDSRKTTSWRRYPLTRNTSVISFVRHFHKMYHLFYIHWHDTLAQYKHDVIYKLWILSPLLGLAGPPP